ncbi:MAG: hypothetical protein ACWA40_03850 [Planktomarina sp.]
MAIGLPILAVGIAIDQYVKNKLRHDKAGFIDKLEKAKKSLEGVSGASEVSENLTKHIEDANSIAASDYLDSRCHAIFWKFGIVANFLVSSVLYFVVIISGSFLKVYCGKDEYIGNFTENDLMGYLLMFTVMILAYQIVGMTMYAIGVNKFNSVIDDKVKNMNQECKNAHLAAAVHKASKTS